jgi:hypothetical protein
MDCGNGIGIRRRIRDPPIGFFGIQSGIAELLRGGGQLFLNFDEIRGNLRRLGFPLADRTVDACHGLILIFVTPIEIELGIAVDVRPNRLFALSIRSTHVTSI